MTAPRRALVVIDVQQEYDDGPLQVRHPEPQQARAGILRAIDLAEVHGLPVVVVQHQAPVGAPVFAVGSRGWTLHPEVERRLRPSWMAVTKTRGSVFVGTDVAAWLAERGVDRITLVGHMTNNCVLATAVGAEELGLAVEVLSDATGTVHLANEAGTVTARQLHEVLLTLLQSNFAAVATVDDWAAALEAGGALPKSSLVASATAGAALEGRPRQESNLRPFA